MKSSAIDWAAVEVLSFDCYGTLIDWERGIPASLRSVLAKSGFAAPEDALLEST